VSADVSELLQYASHVATTVDRAEEALSKVVERGAVNVKREAVSIFESYSSRNYLKHYPRAMSYDMISPLEAEIGPDSAKPQGGMGTGIEFGSVHTQPMPHMFPALDVEMPRFERQIAPIVARFLK
jgi:hypothetical protein